MIWGAGHPDVRMSVIFVAGAMVNSKTLHCSNIADTEAQDAVCRRRFPFGTTASLLRGGILVPICRQMMSDPRGLSVKVSEHVRVTDSLVPRLNRFMPSSRCWMLCGESRDGRADTDPNPLI